MLIKQLRTGGGPKCMGIGYSWAIRKVTKGVWSRASVSSRCASGLMSWRLYFHSTV
jgi:hypothetical protein